MGIVKNQLSGCGEADIFLFLVSMNNGIMAARETYIASTTKIDSMNNGILQLCI